MIHVEKGQKALKTVMKNHEFRNEKCSITALDELWQVVSTETTDEKFVMVEVYLRSQ